MDDHAHSPRRPLEGSRLQTRGEDRPTVPFAQLLGRRVVVREALDGPGARVWCDAGEILVSGPDPDRLHAWASRHRDALRATLAQRWSLHGAWLATKQVAYYDALPGWFVAVDVVDRERDAFVGSVQRREILAAIAVPSAPLLHQATVRSLKSVHAMIGPSRYKTPRWRESLREAARAAGLDVERVVLETDPHDEAVGLDIELEDEDGTVLERIELVRPTFTSAVIDPSGAERLPLVNTLASGVAP